ncbi:hypothetical protein [Desulfosporosinus sp. BICA1-9]|uniref:hypothetical protein n=1 Tax=Desulfosporosinus sp. BICA1-9 TaxID=1531958 RepID=UPI0005F10535|nr:hypothetical protein [Desulfosporosinus sp. BICA1-9]KJS48043.1 MAG: hypothetical protein VR66_16175 [Peptococcaceae bacterium BRH_c23]KJS87662.1 MAG: hypothetical protein JL57_13470 [Desulfosporosinus sp. BICA1-9]HBW37263.1 hypothetical protein [Desulfosporosinus sp.]
MSRGIVIFIEGDTEVEFYTKLIDQLHTFAPGQRFKVDKLIIRNLKGIGNYKNRAKRIFENEVISRNPGVNFTVVLCYDTDVFDLSAKPPVVWSEVEQQLKASGANKIIHVKAKRTIENWFLYDAKGILRYLRLPEDSKIPINGGADVIKTLYKKAGKVYIKGSATKGFVDALDIKAIMILICHELKKLCKELGMKCSGNKCRGNGEQL